MEKLDETLERLRKACETDPQSVDAAWALAQHYADRGWYNRAIDAYRAIAQTHPDNYALLLDYGNACFRRGDHSQALILFSRLTDLKPERIEGWNNLGICYLKTGNNEAAREAFERVLALEPGNAGALINLGNCYQARGDLPKAEELFRHAAANQPDFADAWFNLGNLQLSRKEYGEAAECFRKALRCQPEFGSAAKNLGVACEEMGQLDAALEHYRKALQLNRADAGLYLNLANVLVKKRAYDRAKHYYLRCVQLAPRDIAGWLGLRHLALLRGDIESYVKATLAILQRLEPDDIAESIRILRGLQQAPKIDAILDAADHLAKHSDELDAERLLAYQRRGSDPARIAALRQRLHALQAPSVNIRTCLAHDHLLNGRFDEAARLLDGMDCSDPQRQVLLWKALIGKGKFDEADGAISAYLPAHADWADGWCYAALVQLRLGREAAAKDLLMRGLGCGVIDPALIESDPQLRQLHQSLG